MHQKKIKVQMNNIQGAVQLQMSRLPAVHFAGTVP